MLIVLFPILTVLISIAGIAAGVALCVDGFRRLMERDPMRAPVQLKGRRRFTSKRRGGAAGFHQTRVIDANRS
jgi:hypothetical protein